MRRKKNEIKYIYDIIIKRAKNSFRAAVTSA